MRIKLNVLMAAVTYICICSCSYAAGINDFATQQLNTARAHETKGDRKAALEAYRAAAEAGNAEAQLMLGIIYERGKLAPKNLTESHKWLSKSANQNNVVAQYALGLYYNQGVGVERDPKAGIFWLKKSAEAGDQYGQYEFANVYVVGQSGTPINLSEAAYWYKKSAEQDNTKAQTMLSTLYAAGQGVPINYIEAYKWSSIATMKGDRKAAKVKGLLEESMTKEEILSGKELIIKWQKSHSI